MKHYRDIDAARLMEAVAQQGGRWLDETHASQEHEFIYPDGTTRRMVDNSCEEEALFLVAYDPTEKVLVNEPRLIPDPSLDAPQGRRIAQKDADGIVIYDEVLHPGVPTADKGREGRGFVKVCANDDLMREWPRFKDHMRHSDPTRG